MSCLNGRMLPLHHPTNRSSMWFRTSFWKESHASTARRFYKTLDPIINYMNSLPGLEPWTHTSAGGLFYLCRAFYQLKRPDTKIRDNRKVNYEWLIPLTDWRWLINDGFIRWTETRLQKNKQTKKKTLMSICVCCTGSRQLGGVCSIKP